MTSVAAGVLSKSCFEKAAMLFWQHIWRRLRRGGPHVEWIIMDKKEAGKQTESRNMESKTNYLADLSVGAPGADICQLCVDLFQNATKYALDEVDSSRTFGYGPSAGDKTFLDELSHFLSKEYGQQVCSDNLFLTCGAAHGLQLLIMALLPPMSIVFVEDPTYFLAFDVFKNDFHMRIIPVPMTPVGMDVDILEKRVMEIVKEGIPKVTERKPFWGMVYTIPAFHNPTGISMNEETARRLVEVGRSYGLCIVCDDVYNLLYYNGLPPRRLFSYDDANFGNVVSNCTFSKYLAPGTRVGWIEASSHITNLLKHCGVIHSGGAVNGYMSRIMWGMMASGLQTQHLTYVRQQMAMRMTSAYSILKENLPPQCTIFRPNGGYFLWVEFPHHVDATKMSQKLREKELIVVKPGALFSDAGNYSHCVRISVSYLAKDGLSEAVFKFCRFARLYLEANPASD